MKKYVKATKFMWYSWENSIILKVFKNDFYNGSHYFVGVLLLPIGIRTNVGVVLKSKELRVCAMDVLGFY